MSPLRKWIELHVSHAEILPGLRQNAELACHPEHSVAILTAMIAGGNHTWKYAQQSRRIYTLTSLYALWQCVDPSTHFVRWG